MEIKQASRLISIWITATNVYDDRETIWWVVAELSWAELNWTELNWKGKANRKISIKIKL